MVRIRVRVRVKVRAVEGQITLVPCLNLMLPIPIAGPGSEAAHKHAPTVDFMLSFELWL